MDSDVVSYVARTRGKKSASQRVNELVKKAALQEIYEQLEIEAAAFFADVPATERKETKALEKAAQRTFRRN